MRRTLDERVSAIEASLRYGHTYTSDARWMLARLKEARALLKALSDGDPCVLDHHGYCQTHRLERQCSNARALAWLRGEKSEVDAILMQADQP